MIDDGTMRDRAVVRHNPEQTARDKQVRQRLLDQFSSRSRPDDRARAPKAPRAAVGQARTGALRGTTQDWAVADRPWRRPSRAAPRRQYQPRTLDLDPALSVEDFALGYSYKQPLHVKRGELQGLHVRNGRLDFRSCWRRRLLALIGLA
jgi:hypothetical protein